MGGDRFHEVGEGTQANQGACVSLEDCQAYNQQVRDCEAFNQMVRDWEQMSAAGFENLVVIVGCNNTIAPNSTLEQYALKLIESELARAAEEDPALYAYLSDAIHVEAGEGDERRLLIEQVEHMIAQENSQMFDPDGDGVFNYNNFRAGASLCLPYLTGLNELSEFQESNPGERYRDCGEEIDCTPWVPTNDGQQGSGSGGGSGDQGDDDHGSDQPIDDHSDEPGEDSGEESDEDSGEEEEHEEESGEEEDHEEDSGEEEEHEEDSGEEEEHEEESGEEEEHEEDSGEDSGEEEEESGEDSDEEDDEEDCPPNRRGGRD